MALPALLLKDDATDDPFKNIRERIDFHRSVLHSHERSSNAGTMYPDAQMEYDEFSEYLVDASRSVSRALRPGKTKEDRARALAFFKKEWIALFERCQALDLQRGELRAQGETMGEEGITEIYLRRLLKHTLDTLGALVDLEDQTGERVEDTFEDLYKDVQRFFNPRGN